MDKRALQTNFVSTFSAVVLMLGLCNSATSNASAPPPDDQTRPTIGSGGQLFTIQFTPGNRSLTVAFAGKPAATLDSSKISIFGRLIPLKGSPKNLKIVPVDTHFEIVDEIPASTPIEIEIKDQKTKKSEKIRIDTQRP